MNINNISNFNFKAQYKVNGANSGAKINNKYNDMIKHNRETIKCKKEEITKLRNEITTLNDDIVNIHASRALQLQALYYMSTPEIQDKISKLPNNLIVELSTTPVYATEFKSNMEQPTLNLYSKTSTNINILEKTFTFRLDDNQLLDKNSADEWLDNI